MNTNREKSSDVKGLIISVLLHGIFFAGCLALDASTLTAHQLPEDTAAIHPVKQMPDQVKVKS